LVPISSPLSRTVDNQNALVVTGKHGGETVFSGRGAGGGPTAVAIVSDLLALRRNSDTAAVNMETLQAYRASSNFSFAYLVRFRLAKLAESLPMIREALSMHGVQVESVLKKSMGSARHSGLAMLVKPCSASIIENALHEIDKLQGVPQGAVYLPMLPA
jgi:homoserine dehydrogenase